MHISNYSRVYDNLQCEAHDFHHETEVNDNVNYSSTVITSKNKKKRSLSSKLPLPKKISSKINSVTIFN